MRSFSEIETISKRASRGAGFSWGVSEEIGKSVRLLEMFGLPGILHLKNYLEKINNHNYQKITLISSDNISNNIPYCPISVGVNFLDQAYNLEKIEKIEMHTSHHTHNVIGTGANDPQKMDPYASRETLDHSIMYIFAVALEDGSWHHVKSYAPERARRKSTVALWHKIKTFEDPIWTKKYHHPDPRQKAFGGKVVITMNDGSVISDELGIADAHPNGRRPFTRSNYIEKFKSSYARLKILVEENSQNAREFDGVWSLPNGDDYYKHRLQICTTTDLTADEIHKLGLQMVEEIQSEIKRILSEEGYDINRPLADLFVELNS